MSEISEFIFAPFCLFWCMHTLAFTKSNQNKLSKWNLIQHLYLTVSVCLRGEANETELNQLVSDRR